MRRISRTVVVCIFLLAASARPAHALGEGILDYIDRLSGQGPFWGIGYEMSFFCDQGRTFRDCNHRQSPSADAVNRWEVGPDLTFFRGRLNPKVTYPAGTPDDEKRVNAQTYGAHGNYWVHRSLALTVRARAVHFTGDLVENGDNIWDAVYSVGGIVRVPFKSFAIDFVPQAQFGIGPFDKSQFGALSPMGDDAVKFGFHVGVRF